MDQTKEYVPETTYVSGGFGGSWGGGYYGGYYGGYAPYYGTTVSTTGGYWSTTSVIHLKANLYTHASKSSVWTGEITVTDPTYVDEAAVSIARDIYGDLNRQNMLKGKAK
jgi:hypothetical protein